MWSRVGVAWWERTVVAGAEPPAVNDGFPCQQVALVDGAQPLYAFLLGRLGAPRL